MPELTCKQVNERLAEALNRRIELGEEVFYFHKDDEREFWRRTPQDYCGSFGAVADAERIIADGPKMRAAYLRAIAATLGIEAISDVNSYRWALLTASPETRARALVEVLEETA